MCKKILMSLLILNFVIGLKASADFDSFMDSVENVLDKADRVQRAGSRAQRHTSNVYNRIPQPKKSKPQKGQQVYPNNSQEQTQPYYPQQYYPQPYYPQQYYPQPYYPQQYYPNSYYPQQDYVMPDYNEEIEQN